MAYVNVPNDLSKIKAKLAFNPTKRQLICFGIAAVVGIPTYLFTRSMIGITGAMPLMIGLMLPCFFFAMYKRDGLPFEKALRNIIRTVFIRPPTRPYKTENFYTLFSSDGKEVNQLDYSKKRPQDAVRQSPAKSGRYSVNIPPQHKAKVKATKEYASMGLETAPANLR